MSKTAASLTLAYAPVSIEALENAAPLSPAQQTRTAQLIALWRNQRVSFHNHAREYRQTLPENYALLIDTANDFDKLLAAAQQDYPMERIVLWRETRRAKPPILCIENAHLVGLIEQAQAVYCTDSPLGFEALLWGKAVHCVADSFYRGWGLTDDALPPRSRRLTLEQLVHNVLIAQTYRDAETAEPCEIEQVIEWLGLQRRMRERFAAEVCAVGFSRYKRPIVADFFQGSRVHFTATGETTRAVWGSTKHETDLPLIRLEDGFIRSVGLGADLVRPLSWVMDGRGIYYDATRPSDLEHILEYTDFDEPILQRAEQLQQRLVSSGLTKYNVGAATWQRPSTAQTVILVTGQVEADASLAYGSSEIRSNLALLQAVRAAHPHAYILYKPHPDVVAGLRLQGHDESKTIEYCDEYLLNANMGQLLEHIDEVHTMTSLAGFEALLRGKKVCCYGLPFYAGWGLTQDLIALPRRTRRLSLLELIAGVLILYPTYISRTTGRFTTPERALDELVQWRNQQSATLPFWRKVLRLYLRLELWLKH